MTVLDSQLMKVSRNSLGGPLVETRQKPFVDFRWRVNGSVVGGLKEGLRDDVDCELLGVLDIMCCVCGVS